MEVFVNYMIKKVLTIVLIFTAAGFAGHYRPVEMDSLLRTGKEQIYQLKVPEAAQTFQFMKQRFPDLPQGYVLEAYLTALVYSMDQSNDSLENVLLQQVKEAVDRAEAYRDRNHNNPEAYFYLAIGNGVEALYHVINRSFVKGYFSGRNTKNNLEKAIELDPRYFDAYFGLGVFHYYADFGGRKGALHSCPEAALSTVSVEYRLGNDTGISLSPNRSYAGMCLVLPKFDYRKRKAAPAAYKYEILQHGSCLLLLK